MPYYGAREVTFSQFRGVVFDVDPGELQADRAANAVNCDFDGETLACRKGKSAYNSSVPTASQVRGLFAHYPASGTRKVIMQAGTAIYEDDGAGSFSSAVGSLTGGAPMDFIGYRGNVYAGNGVDAVRKRDTSGTWSTVANLAAPSAAPTVAAVRTVLEPFDSGTWTVGSGSGITPTFDTGVKREGTGCLKLAITAGATPGGFLYKAWSGGNADLSGATTLSLWVRFHNFKTSIQIGIYQNSETLSSGPQWGLFPEIRTPARDTWVQVFIDLSGIDPANRTASPGLAIRLLGTEVATSVYFDDARANGLLVPDTYRYVYTYYDSTTLAESPPSAEGVVTIAPTFPAASINVTTVAATTADKIRIYRRRDAGPFRRFRLVKEVANASATYNDALTDGTIATTNALELVTQRANPPLANTYAIVHHRLLCGDVTVSSVRYPQRIYLSVLGRVEQFGTDEEPTANPEGGGWLDLMERDTIVRIVDFDGMALIFCNRSVWTLEGSAWSGEDEFRLAKRLDVGLVGRWAVAVRDRLVYFLAEDGVRIMAPNSGSPGTFPCWRISEPVFSKIQATSAANRALLAMGVDEQGRVHLSGLLDRTGGQTGALVFDPRINGATDSGRNLQRPGWTYYESWRFTVLHTLRVGGGDTGELLGGDASTAKVWRLQKSGLTDIAQTDGANTEWVWHSPAIQGPPGVQVEPVWVSATCNEKVGTTPIGQLESYIYKDGVLSSTYVTLDYSGATATNILSKEGRFGVGFRGRRVQLRTGSPGSGSSAPFTLRSISLGLYQR